MFEEIEALFVSSTIKPTFKQVHIILALFIFDENPEGIGRYRLQKELLIGEGTAKSLIKKLNEKVQFITVADKKIRKGHVLTDVGVKYLTKIKQSIPIISTGEPSILKNLIIDAERIYSYFCLIKSVSHKITNGIDQRDAAIKVNGSGATCLVFNGKELRFPSKSNEESVNEGIILNKTLSSYFESQLSERNIKLEKDDVIAIGSGITPQKARLATLNAALTLL
ncbi:MAG: DUF4443 domain-containing protein [Promethearchaeota archaeon]|jgi:hypothetical protein